MPPLLLLSFLAAFLASSEASSGPDTMACCKRGGVDSTCAELLCDINAPPSHMQLFSDSFKACSPHLTKVASCLADGRNHVGCCSAEAERPESLCFDLCEGAAPAIALNSSYMEDTHYVQYMSCLAFNLPSIYKCFRKGYAHTPSPPLALIASDVGRNDARLRWSLPAKFPELVNRFQLYYTAKLPGDTRTTRPALVKMDKVSTRTSLRRRSLTLTGLSPGTRYMVYAVATTEDETRLSLPSEAASFVTQGLPPTVAPFPGPSLRATRGRRQILVCKLNIAGLERPRLQISWSKSFLPLTNSAEESSGPKYAQTAYQAALDRKRHSRTIMTTLSVREFGEGDLGTYRCSVNNSLGLATADILLTPPSALSVPSAPPMRARCGAEALGEAPDAEGYLQQRRGSPIGGIVELLQCTLRGSANAGCCVQRRVPERCLGLCDASLDKSPAGSRAGLHLFACLAFSSAIFACGLDAKESLPSAPTGLQAQVASRGSLELSWSESEDADKYHVYWRGQKSSGGWSRETVEGRTSLLIRGAATSQLTLVVVAESSAGLSGASQPLHWPTDLSPDRQTANSRRSPQKLLVAGKLHRSQQ